MAVRAVNNCSIFRSAAAPPFAAFGCRMHQFRAFGYRRHANSVTRLSSFSGEKHVIRHDGLRSYSVHSLVETVMEEIAALHKRRRVVLATNKYEWIIFLSSLIMSEYHIMDDYVTVSWILYLYVDFSQNCNHKQLHSSPYIFLNFGDKFKAKIIFEDKVSNPLSYFPHI